jgi:hypothetical protein
VAELAVLGIDEPGLTAMGMAVVQARELLSDGAQQ